MAEADDVGRSTGASAGIPPGSGRRRVNRHVLRLSWFERAMLFLSKTDTHALQSCTLETRNILNTLGGLVLVTGIMAFISSSFAIESVFFKYEESLLSYLTTFAVALFYAAAIMLIDRELVSMPKKTGFWPNLGSILPRMVMALFIGVVIAFPLELKLQESRIEDEIRTLVKDENTDRIRRLQELRQRVEEAREQERQAFERERLRLEDLLAARKNEVAQALEEYDKECKRFDRCGPRADKLYARKSEAQAALLAAEDAKRDHERRRDEIETAVKRRMADEIKELEYHQQELGRQMRRHDFLSQFEALQHIHQTVPGAKWLSYFLMGFFIMFELLPLTTKLQLPYTEYHAYLDARRSLQVNKIIGVTNLADAQIRARLQQGDIQLDDVRQWLGQSEITDILEEVMEDRLQDFQPLADTPSPDEGGRA